MVKRPDKYLPLCIYLILAAASFAAYHQTLRNDFVNFDDDKYVTENLHVRTGMTADNVRWAFGFTKIVYWIPLAWLSHILDCQLFGLRPGLHHLTNLLLHIANALLLFAVFKRITGALWKSAAVAALFALHPVNVDSVAWVAERKNVLSTFFWMLTMLAYIYYTERPSVLRYLLIIAVFILGLLSKPMLVTLPFVLLLLDYWPLRRKSNIKYQKSKMRNAASLIPEKVPLFILSAVWMYVSSVSFKDPSYAKVVPMDLRTANAAVSYTKYILNMVWPVDLAVLYPYPSSVPAWQFAGSLILLMFVSGFVILLRNKKPYLVVGWLWYVGTLVPVLGLVQIGLWPAMADRWLYVPSVGIFIMVVWLAGDLAADKLSEIVIRVLAAAVFLVLGTDTYFQTRYWRSSQVLFEHALMVTKDNYIMHNNLGSALASQKKFDEAVNHYNLAIRICPSYTMAYNNLGSAMELQGKTDEAISYYRRAIQLKPDYAEAYGNLGKALRSQGKNDEAIGYYFKALQINPNLADTHYNLANLLKSQDRFDEATEHYSKAIQINPYDVEIYNNLAGVLQLQGKVDEAMNLYRQTLSIEPNYAPGHHNLGGLLVKKGRFDEALEHFYRASSLKPDWSSPLNSLAKILITHPDINKRNINQAVVFAKRAAELTNHQDMTILNTLASVYAAAGRYEEAIKTARAALEIAAAGGDNELADYLRKQLEIYRTKTGAAN